jgi:LPXTG-motif cell wall-anchored protein
LTTVEGKWEVIRGLVRFTPKDGFTGRTAAVAFEVTDTEGATVGATLRVTVDPGFVPGNFLPATGSSTNFGVWAVMLLLAGLVLRRLRRFV